MAKRELMTCPKCGRATIQPVDEWEHDFLAVHRVEIVVIGEWDNKYLVSKLVEWCTPISSVVSTLPVKKIVRKVDKIKEEKGLF